VIFWFNTDFRLAIPSVSIPYGQRFIYVDIESLDKILYVAPGNLYLQLTVETANNVGGTSIGAGATTYDKYVTLTPVLADSSTVNSPTFDLIDLYINNIFMNPEIHDIYIKRIGFSLIRVHLRQITTVNMSASDTQLTQLKWPIEYMFVGMRPSYNTSNSNPNQYRDWHHLTAMVDQVLDAPANASSRMNVTGAAWSVAPSAVVPESASQQSVGRDVYAVEIPTIDTVKVVAHGITIFDTFAAPFYRDYMPYTYGGPNINTPDDKGALMINFCLYPGTYQPSGHMNLSRAREFFIQIASSYASASTPVELIVQASALNFLLISDGSAVLRYST